MPFVESCLDFTFKAIYDYVKHLIFPNLFQKSNFKANVLFVPWLLSLLLSGMSKNSTITIYCIYNAKGSIIGELKYLLLKYFYGFKCSMCEITHNSFSEKKEWGNQISQSSYTIKAVHLDEQSDDLYQFSIGKAPCVVGENSKGFKLIFTSDELNSFKGDVHQFFNKLDMKAKLILSH